MRSGFVLIDDDRDELELLQNGLLSFGFSGPYVHFTCPDRAIRELSVNRNWAPAYIFMNFNLSGERSDELLRKFRNARSLDETIIVILSSNMPQEVSCLLREIGADFELQRARSVMGYQKILGSIMKAAAPVSAEPQWR